MGMECTPARRRRSSRTTVKVGLRTSVSRLIDIQSLGAQSTPKGSSNRRRGDDISSSSSLPLSSLSDPDGSVHTQASGASFPSVSFRSAQSIHGNPTDVFGILTFIDPSTVLHPSPDDDEEEALMDSGGPTLSAGDFEIPVKFDSFSVTQRGEMKETNSPDDSVEFGRPGSQSLMEHSAAEDHPLPRMDTFRDDTLIPDHTVEPTLTHEDIAVPLASSPTPRKRLSSTLPAFSGDRPRFTGGSSLHKVQNRISTPYRSTAPTTSSDPESGSPDQPRSSSSHFPLAREPFETPPRRMLVPTERTVVVDTPTYMPSPSFALPFATFEEGVLVSDIKEDTMRPWTPERSEGVLIDRGEQGPQTILRFVKGTSWQDLLWLTFPAPCTPVPFVPSSRLGTPLQFSPAAGWHFANQ